jgi:monothiol glutaredoxin
MKGYPDAPQCGFSAIASRLLLDEGVKDIKAVNVLESAEIREGIKEHTGWKTIPQVFIKGGTKSQITIQNDILEFIGGADIIKEMYQTGQLAEKLQPVLGK